MDVEYGELVLRVAGAGDFVLARCFVCFALVAPEDKDAHTQTHQPPLVAVMDSA